MTLKKARGSKGKADRYFSLIVRFIGECERCGETEYAKLQTAHIWSRRFSATRCDFDNAFCLCARCHRIFTDQPVPFAWFTMQRRTPAQLARLAELIDTKHKPDWDALAFSLQAMWNEITEEQVHA